MDINTIRGSSHTQPILDCLRTLVRALSTESRRSETQLGITGAQRFILQTLRNAKTLSINELAVLTYTHQSTVSTVVTKLVEKGLISRTRDPNDRRVQLLSITAKGRSKLRSESITVQEKLIHSIGELGHHKQQQLTELLQQLIKGSGLAQIEPTLFLERTRTNKRAKQHGGDE
jgi:DNA-binding MarR family transcriptional regulator